MSSSMDRRLGESAVGMSTEVIVISRATIWEKGSNRCWQPAHKEHTVTMIVGGVRPE
jgi:hypothetical protein